MVLKYQVLCPKDFVFKFKTVYKKSKTIKTNKDEGIWYIKL